MTPPLPIPPPDPLPLPAPAWLLQFLLVFTFVLHIIPMNLVLGGSMLAAWSLWRRTDRHRELARQLVRALPAATALTITSGVAPLLFLQVLYGQFFYAASILIAVPWFAVVPLLIAAYYGFYFNYFSREPLTGKHVAVAIASAVLVLAIGSIYTGNLTLMLTPERWRAFSPEAATFGAKFNTGEPTLLPRFLHFAMASLAVTGLFIALRASRLTDETARRWQLRYGALWFAVPTLLNIGVGLWFLFSLPANVRALFLGGSAVHTAHLWAGVGFALVALMLSLLAVNAARPCGLLWAASATLLLTISLMATVRHFVRGAYLAPHFDPATLAVRPMWDVFAVFALLLVAGLGVIGWMLKNAFPKPVREA
jgi:hypothetical protein